jgi:site-specific DNA-methyltransferase (adenine-specific)
MERNWDHAVPGVPFWAEALRVAKPGAHLVAFGGTRTYHRLTCAIEDAGWEIRDCLSWLYGSGFPKSLDVSKAIDKGSAETRDRALRFTAWMRSTGITLKQINAATNTAMGLHYLTDKSQPAIATADMFDLLRPHLPKVPEEIERLVAERTGIEWTAYKQRAVVGSFRSSLGGTVAAGLRDQDFIAEHRNKIVPLTAPSTNVAKQWQGWGTALKPAWEPIILARKPLVGTVAANVLAHGTGAINVDACRIGISADDSIHAKNPHTVGTIGANGIYGSGEATLYKVPHGRWPANVALDEEAAAMLDKQTGISTSRKGNPRASVAPGVGWGMTATGAEYDDSGGASRFFYTAKASRSERNDGCDAIEARPQDPARDSDAPGGNNPRNRGAAARVNSHPTVKPVALMRWLVRMVTPPGGVVLDPFCGSGTTLVAAIEEGFDCIGVEREAQYVAIIEARVAAAQQRPQRVEKPKTRRAPRPVAVATTAPPAPIATARMPWQLALTWEVA